MSRDACNLFLVGTGVVGSALLEILRGPRGVDVAGVANRRGALFSPEGPPLEPDRVAELVRRPRVPGAPDARIDDATLDALARLPRAVLVDATADAGIAPLYERALARGIHVVTANKKPIAGPLAARAPIFDLASRPGGPKLRYSATVGAGLPVIETLKDLVRTGDQVERIDCVLSGTLGFLSNALAAGVPLSRAVATARERGYTEPDPREDLGGADVARKAVILARELGGRAIEVDDVVREPFVPAEVLARATPEALDGELVRLDGEYAARAARLAKRGEKWVYLARIEASPSGGVRATAGPTAVPRTHPAAHLEGSSALVAFSSARHASDPLVIRGAGAGGAVTAAAVLADALKVSGVA